MPGANPLMHSKPAGPVGPAGPCGPTGPTGPGGPCAPVPTSMVTVCVGACVPAPIEVAARNPAPPAKVSATAAYTTGLPIFMVFTDLDAFLQRADPFLAVLVGALALLSDRPPRADHRRRAGQERADRGQLVERRHITTSSGT